MDSMSDIVKALSKNDLTKTPKSKSRDSQAFYSEFELPSDTLHIEVEGIGVLNFPLTQTDISKLLNISSDAKFGLREKTLLDRNIRDTQEISAEKIQIKYDENVLEDTLNKLKVALALPENCNLTPHLHNMLIYAPGQFFKKHQDSEKLEGMVASLVIVLPAPHIGGNLIIQHNNMEYSFVSENLDNPSLNCIAFYADCHHEVKKVKQSYRIALTYNLVLTSRSIELPDKINQPLEKALKDYFCLDGLFTKTIIEPSTTKLIYFLDHSYTEHSLRWGMLKGADSKYARDFLKVSKRLDLIPHLALMEHHESWATEYDEEEPVELITDDTTLSYWLDENDQKLPYKEYATCLEDECCWTIETKQLEPYETEQEGYMGNYGNTIDYWYRRAAIVLWHKDNQIAINFELNYENALRNLLKLTEQQGNEKQVLDIIQKAGNYLLCNSQYNYRTADLSFFLQLAFYIKNKDIAKLILSNFALVNVEADSILELAKFQDLYGISWCQEMLVHWRETGIKSNSFPSVRNDILFIVQHLLEKSEHANIKIVEFLLDYWLYSMIEYNKRYIKASPIELANSLKERMNLAKDFMRASALLQNDLITKQFIEYLISEPILYPEFELTDAFLSVQNERNNYQSQYVLLKEHLINKITQKLEMGLRAEDDLSIKTESSCNCSDCNIILNFLKSKTESKRIWPIAEARRGHIMNVFQRLNLPIKFFEEKTGSPYKLVITKSDQLYQTDKKRYDNLKTYFNRLSVT